MNFNDALNAVHWDYTATDGTTLAVIPDEAGALVRITDPGAKTTEDRIATTDLPDLVEALARRGVWTQDMVDEMWCDLVPTGGGGMMLSLSEDPDPVDRETQIHIPEEQRLPLASALSRVLDVARGWES